jgi:hypothetical protein
MVAGDGAVAVEIEFAPKDADRLARILRDIDPCRRGGERAARARPDRTAPASAP